MFSWMGNALSTLSCQRPVIPGHDLKPSSMLVAVALDDEWHLRARPY